MIIAIEFDGGVVKNCYPEIGEEQPFARYIIEQLKMRGHQIILVTHRTGEELERALGQCESRGFTFDSVLDGYADRSEQIQGKSDEMFLVTEKILEKYTSWINLYWKFYPEEYDHTRLRNSGFKKSKWKKLFNKKDRGGA